MSAPPGGGEATIHVAVMPPHLNRALSSSLTILGVWDAVHEGLLGRDPTSGELEPRVASSWGYDDLWIFPVDGASLAGDPVRVETPEGPRDCVLVGGGAQNTHLTPLRVVRQGAITMHLRDDVRWHDGHPFDAEDVLFSWRIYANPHVRCDAWRATYSAILQADSPSPGSVRFLFDEERFDALARLAELPLLPRHHFDLSDPDHPDHDPLASPEACAEAIHGSAHNRMWVGLGPYRVTAMGSDRIEASRFAGYFAAGEPRLAGRLERLRWRHVAGEDAAFQATLAGELDLYAGVRTSEYYGDLTRSEAFQEGFARAALPTGQYGYTVWNTLDPRFAERDVRLALAQAFDLEGYLASAYYGLGTIVTGPLHLHSPSYDHSVQPPTHDPEAADALLTGAGWYDRDGDEVRDKDGTDLAFELLIPAGNRVSRDFALRYQEALAPLGVRVELVALEWATFAERINARRFDAAHLAHAPHFEGDPEKRWHSRWALPGGGTPNFASLRDAEVDRLIEAIQRELDPGQRRTLWHGFHRRVAELQPCFFQINAPIKLVLNRRLDGLVPSLFPPGYAVRRLYERSPPAGSSSAAPRDR